MNAKTRSILDEDAKRREREAREWQRQEEARARRKAILQSEDKPGKLTWNPFAKLGG